MKVVVLLKDDIQSSMILDKLSIGFVSIHNFNNSKWFSGYLSENALKKLENDSTISRVYIPPKTRALLSESLPLIKANYIWNRYFGNININGKNQTICIVDTGINKNHPDLIGKVVAEHCFCNPNCCPNGQNEDTNASDGDGHGTFVSGIVSANGFLKGISFESNIVSVRVTKDDGTGDEDDLGYGIKWCENHNR